MSIKLRAWDNFNAEMFYSDKYDNLQDFFYDVKRRENGGNLVSLMLASNQFDCEGVQIFEGDIVKFVHGGIRTGIVECRPEHFCYWQVKVPGDRFGLGWVMNCCVGVVVTGNHYADRELLEDEGLVGLLDEPEPENKVALPESDYRDDFGNTIKSEVRVLGRVSRDETKERQEALAVSDIGIQL
jgi:hypothetical protein